MFRHLALALTETATGHSSGKVPVPYICFFLFKFDERVEIGNRNKLPSEFGSNVKGSESYLAPAILFTISLLYS